MPAVCESRWHDVFVRMFDHQGVLIRENTIFHWFIICQCHYSHCFGFNSHTLTIHLLVPRSYSHGSPQTSSEMDFIRIFRFSHIANRQHLGDLKLSCIMKPSVAAQTQNIGIGKLKMLDCMTWFSLWLRISSDKCQILLAFQPMTPMSMFRTPT